MKTSNALGLVGLLPLVLLAGGCTPTSPGPGDGGMQSPPAACPAPSGSGTMHTGNIGTETWTAADSPHIVPDDTNVVGTLTVDPCAEVLIAGAKTVTIMSGGSIVAHGDAMTPIHVGAVDPNAPFAQIRTTPGGTMSLAYVTVDGGGNPLNTIPELTGMIDLQGADQTMPSQETIAVDHVTLNGSQSNGIVLRDGAGFAAGSTALTISGAGIYPMSIWARAVGNIPDGTYTGNAKDEILLPADHAYSDFYESTTLHERGVPYHVGSVSSQGQLMIPAVASMPTLTIESGVVMRFKRDGVFLVDAAQSTSPARAVLVAAGSADKPIVFTSAEDAPAAGDWRGIWFGELPSQSNRIDYARIEFAGATTSTGSDSCVQALHSPNDAAVRIFGEVEPFITNTTISDSLTNGIDRGFRSATKPDFLPTNTFARVALCKETYPKDLNGSCPAAPPCP